MDSLQEKRVIVVGGTGNVGRHLVRGLLEAGADVFAPSRSAGRIEALHQSLPSGLRSRLKSVVADMADPADADRVLRLARPLDGAVASLGHFRAAPAVLDAPAEWLEGVLDDYLRAHLRVAQSVIPALRSPDGAYVMINGPLAFEARPGSGLVSIVTAAQAMLARVLMREAEVRVNEVVLYSGFGWGNEEQNAVSGEEIGRFVAELISERGRSLRGLSIHLRTPAELEMTDGRAEVLVSRGGEGIG